MKDYIAKELPSWSYFGIDPAPKSKMKIWILTKGGVAVIGNANTVDAIAWAPMIKRDPVKESFLKVLDPVEDQKWLQLISGLYFKRGVFKDMDIDEHIDNLDFFLEEGNKIAVIDYLDKVVTPEYDKLIAEVA